MNNPVFERTMENEKKYRYVELVTTEKRRSYFVSEPNDQQIGSQKTCLKSK